MHQINRLDLEQKIGSKINDESRRTYTSNDIKSKTKMLRSNLCDYADANILVKGTITILVMEMMMRQNNQMKEIKP